MSGIGWRSMARSWGALKQWPDERVDIFLGSLVLYTE